MFPTNQIIYNSVTLDVIKDLQFMAVQLFKIETREDRVELFNKLSKILDVETFIFLGLVYKSENEHKIFMTHILSQFPECAGRKPHDFSKDALFYFVEASWVIADITSREFKYLIDSELIRYFTLESHNSAYEKLNDYECSKTDIRVCALARLARYIQFRGGVDMDVMNRTKPVYSKGNNDRKQLLFWNTVLKYKDFVTREYDIFSS